MGTVTRRVHLSDALNADGVEASYRNGVLEVTVPVAERAKPRKVEVRQTEDHKELVGQAQA
jgi:HSP20 family protein